MSYTKFSLFLFFLFQTRLIVFVDSSWCWIRSMRMCLQLMKHTVEYVLRSRNLQSSCLCQAVLQTWIMKRHSIVISLLPTSHINIFVLKAMSYGSLDKQKFLWVTKNITHIWRFLYNIGPTKIQIANGGFLMSICVFLSFSHSQIFKLYKFILFLLPVLFLLSVHLLSTDQKCEQIAAKDILM